MAKQDKVALVTTRVFSPYRKDEVFTLPAADAKKVVEKSKGAVEYYKGKGANKSPLKSSKTAASTETATEDTDTKAQQKASK